MCTKLWFEAAREETNLQGVDGRQSNGPKGNIVGLRELDSSG